MITLYCNCIAHKLPHAPIFIEDDNDKSRDVLIGIGHRLLAEHKDPVIGEVGDVYLLEAHLDPDYELVKVTSMLTEYLAENNGFLLVHNIGLAYEELFDDTLRSAIAEFVKDNRVIGTVDRDFFEDNNVQEFSALHFISDGNKDRIKAIDMSIEKMSGMHNIQVKFTAEDLLDKVYPDLKGNDLVDFTNKLLDDSMSMARRRGKKSITLKDVKNPQITTAQDSPSVWSIDNAGKQAVALRKFLLSRIHGQDNAIDDVVEGIKYWMISGRRRPHEHVQLH